MARPAALGLDVSVKSLEDADVVLAELSWLANEQARLDAICKQKIEAIKTASSALAVVEVEETSCTFDERVAALTKPLSAWVAKNITKHLDGKKKALNLTHGTLGLRQQPLVAQVVGDSSTQSVLDAIDETTGLVLAVQTILERKVAALGKSVTGRDLISVEIKPALKPMKDAIVAKRLTREQVEAFGVSLREAFDEAVIKPANLIVSSEA